jgi:hypothetical protein
MLLQPLQESAAEPVAFKGPSAAAADAELLLLLCRYSCWACTCGCICETCCYCCCCCWSVAAAAAVAPDAAAVPEFALCRGLRPQVRWWTFQSAAWHSLEQYLHVTKHTSGMSAAKEVDPARNLYIYITQYRDGC